MIEKRSGSPQQKSTAAGVKNFARLRPPASSDVTKKMRTERKSAAVEARSQDRGKSLLIVASELSDDDRKAKIASLQQVLGKNSGTFGDKIDLFYELQCYRACKDSTFRAMDEAAWNAGLRGFLVDLQNDYFSLQVVPAGYAVASQRSYKLIQQLQHEYPELVSRGAGFLLLRLAEISVTSEERREFARQFKPESVEEVGVLHASRKILESLFPDSDVAKMLTEGSSIVLRKEWVLSSIFESLARNGTAKPAAFGANPLYSFLKAEVKLSLDVELAETLQKPEIGAISLSIKEVSSFSAAQIYNLLQTITANGFEDARGLLTIPDGCALNRDENGFTASLGEGTNANRVAIDLATGDKLSKNMCEYSIDVYDSQANTYITLIDSKRKIIIRHTLLSERQGSWQEFAGLIKTALAQVAAQEKNHTDFSFVLNDVGRQRVLR
ncbi:MAG: hypothetical protein V1492_02835 [Candidatus Micrarchaeota archaeon]